MQVEQVVSVTVEFSNITGDPMWLPSGAISTPGGCGSREPAVSQPFDITMTVRIQGCYVGSGTLQVSTTADGGLASQRFTVSASTTADEPPPAPSGFTITIQTGWGAQARWSYLDGAVEYRIEYRAAGDTTWSSVTSKRDWLLVTGLTPGVTYEFRLSARGSGTTYTTAWGTPTGIISATMTAPLRFNGPVSDLTFNVAQAETVVLPEATGGTAPYTYSVTPALPSGLSFAAATRIISGAPTAKQEAATYRYTVTESGNATWYEEFTIAVEEPAVDLEAVGYDLFEGQSGSLTASSESNVDTIYWLKWSGTGWTQFGSSTDNPATLTVAAADFASNPVGIRVRATFEDSDEEAVADTILIQWRAVGLALYASNLQPSANESVTLSVSGDIPSGATYQWQTRNGDGDTWTNAGTGASISVSAAKAVRQYRVKVSHATASAAVSDTIHITWDAYRIYTDLGGDLRDAVESNTSWVTTQRVLVQCMTQSRPGRSPLTRAVAGSFAAILANYSGDVRERIERDCRSQGNRMFVANDLTHDTELQALRSTALYDDLLDTPAGDWIFADFADAKKLRRNARRAAEAAAGDSTGLDCQSSDTIPGPTDVDSMLDVLNCLVFDTDHSFWVKGGGTRDADTLRQHDTTDTGKYRWLDTQDWKCTPTPQGAVPSCLKHDVAYGTLQDIGGANNDAGELDRLWNPRNKTLADDRFQLDINAHGCQDEDIPDVLDLDDFCELPNAVIAGIYHNAVLIGNMKWPMTKTELAEVRRNNAYVECVNPPVPMALNFEATKNADGDFQVEFDLTGGCSDISIYKIEYILQWHYDFTKSGFPSRKHVLSPTNPSCGLSHGRLTCIADVAEDTGIVGKLTIYAQPIVTELERPELRWFWRHYGGHGENEGRLVTQNMDLHF